MVDATTDNDQLLTLLGEELKQPLVTIAQLAELESSDDIVLQAKRALRTIDNVMLYRRFSSGQISMNFEPVHVGSAMQTVEHTMRPLMRQQGCNTELQLQHSLQTVDVDRQLLVGAVESLWQAFSSTIQGSAHVICSARKTAKGIRLSLKSPMAVLDEVHFSKVNSNSTQPITAFAGPSADIMTAQQLFSLLGVQITKSKNSLGVTLPASKQLQMV